MKSSRRAIVFSIIILITFTIPAASQTVEIKDSGDGFDAFVDSGFSTAFDLNISEGLERLKLKDSEGSYSIESTPSALEKKLVTPRGTLEIKRTANMSVKTVRTPYGTLKTGFRDGENVSSFTGPEKMRNKVKKIRKGLLENLTVKDREASAKKSVVMEKMLPDVEIEPRFTNSSEYVLVSNTGENNVSMKGWQIENSDPDRYQFDMTLGPGESVKLYSGEVPEPNGTLANTGIDIDEYEDNLVLENQVGRIIDEVKW